jgi:hypothetical protein
VDLGRRIASQLKEATFERIAAAGLANAERNRPHIQRSILELTERAFGAGDAAIVVAAGPSLHRRQSLARLRAARFTGAVIAVDGALGACLRDGIVPDVVVSVDPHAERIVRWFGDPSLSAPSSDDYFRRQEMDPTHAADEMRANRDLVALVDRHGPRLTVAIATSASPRVVERCEQAGMTLCWWNPMYDDYEQPQSVSRRLHEANGLPCLNGGGNVGTAAWVIAHAVLGKRRIGLLGMDFAYPPGTPYARTQYYPELREMFGERHEEAFIHLDSPWLGERWFTDPAYYWFRDVFLEMAQEADAETVNCTEGGILHGERVPVAGLDEFLAKTAGGR